MSSIMLLKKLIKIKRIYITVTNAVNIKLNVNLKYRQWHYQQ